MKNYFIRLFNYDLYANKILLDSMQNSGYPEKTVKLMAHLLTAQQVWLGRCKEMSLTNYNLWPNWEASALTSIMNNNANEWQEHLNGLDDNDFEKVITYKNTRGDSFETKLVDILTQVTNHGTHHRAQIGQHLIMGGATTLPATDYIAYVRYIQQ